MLEKHLWNRFLLHLVIETLQLVHEVSSFPQVLYKIGALKNFWKFTEKHKTGVFLLIKLQAENLKLTEAAVGDGLQNKVFLKTSQMSQEKTFIGVCF